MTRINKQDKRNPQHCSMSAFQLKTWKLRLALFTKTSKRNGMKQN